MHNKLYVKRSKESKVHALKQNVEKKRKKKTHLICLRLDAHGYEFGITENIIHVHYSKAILYNRVALHNQSQRMS